MLAYALKHKGGYLRFGSYRSATVVFSPIKATLYSRLSDAEKRRAEHRHWINDLPIPGENLELVALTFAVTHETVVVEGRDDG